jgi:hypothetical protein
MSANASATTTGRDESFTLSQYAGLSDMTVETPETVAARIRRALPHVPAERIVVGGLLRSTSAYMYNSH